MRIALIQCSDEEIAALQSSMAEEYLVVSEGPVTSPPFDFAVLGSATIVDGQVAEEVQRRISCPAMVILASRELYASFDGDMAAITLDGMERLPFMVRRELRHDTVARRRVDAALAARETQLSLAHQVAQLGTWEWDLATGMLHLAPETKNVFGFASDSIPLEEALAAVVPGDRARVSGGLRATGSTGAVFDERYGVQGVGAVQFVHTRAERFGSAGENMRVIGVVQDVTAEVLSQAALRESEFRYRDLVAQVPGGVWSADESGRIVFVSEKVVELTGYTRDEILAAQAPFWKDTIGTEDLMPVPGRWQSMLQGGAFESEFRFRRKDGRSVWLHVRASLVEGEPVSARAIVGVATDVTDRRTAEDALRASEARYRTLVEGARDVIVSIDCKGLVESINRATEELTGGSRVAWIGRPIVEALSPESAARAQAHFEAIAAGGPFDGYTEYELRTRSGRMVTMETQVRPVEAHGEVVGIVIVGRDVTARKESEARMEKEKRLASLGQLATSVAHEFNNVLMSIMPFAELLQRRLPDDPLVGSSTGHIMQAVRRGREISQEILRFARPATATLEPVMVCDWIQTYQRKAQALLGPRYTVSLDLPAGELLCVADRLLLDQVATNLTTNARDAMPDGGELRIAARQDGDVVQILFSDSGSGVPPELFDRIFEPLFSTKRDGNGLGLSVAHQAMVQLDGTIAVSSVVGEGSTFTLTLPATSSPRLDGQVGGLLSRRILIVEDDESVGEGLCILLTDEGFEVRLIDRGLQAAPAIETFSPELVLLDVNLPDVSGFEVYDQIRARWPDLPVIFSTGHADSRALSELDQRSVPSIMKPYDLAELMAVVASVTP